MAGVRSLVRNNNAMGHGGSLGTQSQEVQARLNMEKKRESYHLLIFGCLGRVLPTFQAYSGECEQSPREEDERKYPAHCRSVQRSVCLGSTSVGLQRRILCTRDLGGQTMPTHPRSQRGDALPNNPCLERASTRLYPPIVHLLDHQARLQTLAHGHVARTVQRMISVFHAAACGHACTDSA